MNQSCPSYHTVVYVHEVFKCLVCKTFWEKEKHFVRKSNKKPLAGPDFRCSDFPAVLKLFVFTALFVLCDVMGVYFRKADP